MARQISIFASPELQAVRATTKAIPKEVASVLNKATKEEALPLWRAEVSKNTRTALQRRVLESTATVSVTRLNVRLQAARKGGPLSGGGRPQQLWVGAEFGAKRFKQFGPRNVNPGKVVYPAAETTVPKIATIWAEKTAEVVADAFKGR